MDGYTVGRVPDGRHQVVFEYVGTTSMVAEYFPEPGARVPIDPLDRAGMLHAPNLREAR